ncbi:MAG TPA: GNAT family N-acetyltransferase [Bacteriovoracaceae bacterium]|nr:GNAT family N-acetyltransferase [Bacteriovoracaceae bacterium]
MLHNIETNSLILRPFTLDDVDIIFSLSQEAGMRKWIPDQVYKNTEQTTDVLNYLISHYQDVPNPNIAPIVFAIISKERNEVIGHIGLSPIENSVEIGYAIAEKQCGKGYASQAVTAFSKWAIKELKIKKIMGIVASENVGSGRVLEKSGYFFERENEQMYLGEMRLCRRYFIE